ncbi:ribosome maturation factor RimM [Sulfurimonas sp.]|jgi:16S rRNA processing protein RimM|uniref:ribosome maturation factor RimM n=1 Tax=Sulfurimonas sp. TaxID=2022749 RepID=UPI0025F04F69|nr:ribosome maturation factor RimM [Sulfurimonas sp.]MBT5936016.1 16S rRNA processing protein RimM [Sulfurimonas sp.]
MSKHNKELLHIATIGKTVGIKGDMKFHDKSDFPEQFQAGSTFFINKKDTITLTEVNFERGLIKINNLSNPLDCKKFTNAKLYTTYEETRKNCHLEEGEYFFFDLEDCEVHEDGKLLGVVEELDRIGVTNYLNIVTDKSLVESGNTKKFLVPFMEPFKVSVDIDKKIITLSGAMDILSAS